jgi:predicted ATP-grasp superfamily ATP-dependent carboligase
MKTKLILALISPFRAHLYDFSSLRLPVSDKIELMIICDEGTLINIIPQTLHSISHKVSLVNYADPVNSLEAVRYLSLSEIEQIIEEQLALDKQVVIYSEEEMFLDHLAILNDKFKLDGLSYSDMQKFRNKFIMKQELAKQVHNNFFNIPQFAYVDEKIDLPDNFPFPLICKPLNLAGAIGVKKCNNQAEFDEYRIANKSAIICEEYIIGECVHCDLLIIDNKICFFLAASYYYPIDIATIELNYIGSYIITDKTKIEKLCAASKAVVDYLQTPNGVVHVEFMLNDDKIYFIEIGKRPAGAWVPRMYHRCYDISILNYHLESFYLPVEKFSKPGLKYKHSAGVHLLLPTSGILNEIKFSDKLNTGCEFNAIESKFGHHQVKTYSVLDAVAEAVIYSNDKIQFDATLSSLLSDTKISVV